MGKRLAKISKQAKERKARQRFEQEEKDKQQMKKEMKEMTDYIDFRYFIGGLTLAATLAGLCFAYKKDKRDEKMMVVTTFLDEEKSVKKTVSRKFETKWK